MGVALVCVSEPGRPLLFAADKRNPFVAASAEAFPHVRVAIHASCLLGLLERIAGRRADTVGKALVVPKSRVLEHQPPPWLADAAPTLALVAMPANPSRRVQIAIEPQLLLVRHKILVGGVHILWWRRDLLFVQRGVQVRRIGQVRVVAVKRMGIRIALQHPEEAMGKQWWRVLILMVHVMMETVGRQLRRKEHAVAVEGRRVAEQIRVLLSGLEIAKVQG